MPNGCKNQAPNHHHPRGSSSGPFLTNQNLWGILVYHRDEASAVLECMEGEMVMPLSYCAKRVQKSGTKPQPPQGFKLRTFFLTNQNLGGILVYHRDEAYAEFECMQGEVVMSLSYCAKRVRKSGTKPQPLKGFKLRTFFDKSKPMEHFSVS